jgi:acyl-CoA synthetase (NDP forming)
MNSPIAKLTEALHAAHAEGRKVLLEHEIYAALTPAGLEPPDHVFLPSTDRFVVPASFREGPVVVKIVSPDILHKTELGGIQFLDGATLDGPRLQAFAGEVAARYSAQHGGWPDIRGVLLSRRVAYDRARLGTEVLVGMKWSREFGFIGVVGLGGVKAELWADRLPRGESTALFALGAGCEEVAVREILRTLGHRDLAGELRGSTALLDASAWYPVVRFLREAAEAFPPVTAGGGEVALEELELNPVLVDPAGRLVPVDGLARLTTATAAPSPRPVQKLAKLFKPKTVAVAGVSSKNVNMGRVILRNLLRDGWDKSRLSVLKPDDASIDGVKCYAEPADLPKAVDLAVLAVAAPQVPELFEKLMATRKAESIIVIPGGMGETEGGKALQQRVVDSIEEARHTPWLGPVVCGPNSLGIASVPGHYDTTFIPASKLPAIDAVVRNVAWVSQSGAFAISRLSKSRTVGARYLVSVGNQMDLTLGDYVEFFQQDADVHVIAVYAEGFAAGDGARFLAAARSAISRGKTVVLYKGGRSPEGQGATAGHTASIAGDYRVAWQLARAAGVLVAETFEDFEGLVELAAHFASRTVRGDRVMMMSNAGYEAVGMADALRGEDGRLAPAGICAHTREKVRVSLARHRIDALVSIHNPLDVTPVAPDVVHLECARALLDDPCIDALVMGIVPLSPAMSTVEVSDDPQECLTWPDSLALGLPELAAATDKPIVVVVDSGALYDPLVRCIERGGIPVFRSSDRAVRLLGRYVASRLAAHPGVTEPRPCGCPCG